MNKLTIKDTELAIMNFRVANKDDDAVLGLLNQLLDTRRENERLKQENELFRKGFGLAQTIKDYTNKDTESKTSQQDAGMKYQLPTKTIE